jgi:hypothetical protein
MNMLLLLGFVEATLSESNNTSQNEVIVIRYHRGSCACCGLRQRRSLPRCPAPQLFSDCSNFGIE